MNAQKSHKRRMNIFFYIYIIYIYQIEDVCVNMLCVYTHISTWMYIKVYVLLFNSDIHWIQAMWPNSTMLCMYMNVYRCIWMYIDVYKCIWMYMNVCIWMYIWCVYVYMVCICIWMYIWRVHVCIYPCLNMTHMNINCEYNYECMYLWMNMNVYKCLS